MLPDEQLGKRLDYDTIVSRLRDQVVNLVGSSNAPWELKITEGKVFDVFTRKQTPNVLWFDEDQRTAAHEHDHCWILSIERPLIPGNGTTGKKVLILSYRLDLLTRDLVHTLCTEVDGLTFGLG